MLICYSVCLWHDEKHSYQIHWRRGILGRDWSCCWLAWQQSRAWRLSDRNVHRKAFVLPVFSSERGMTQKKKTVFVLLICIGSAVDIVLINYVKGKEKGCMEKLCER